MKKILAILSFVLLLAGAAQAQTQTTPAEQPVLTPEMQAQRAADARTTYDAQKQQAAASAQASRDTRSAMKESKNQMREQKNQMRAQNSQLKEQRRTEKAAKASEKAARTQMKDEKRKAKALN